MAAISIKLEKSQIYRNKDLILKDINFEITRGQFAFLIGRVGSGKTSLMKTLYAQLPLNEGVGIVCGYNLSTISRSEIPYFRRRLGIVFQDFGLMQDRNVVENLEFVLRATGTNDKNDIKYCIKNALERVGMLDKIQMRPHQLSGGEQQRVAIARALLNTPEIIFADEPTGNLDPITSEGIMGIFRQISNNGTTIFMATHNYTLFEKTRGRIFQIENQRITEKL